MTFGEVKRIFEQNNIPDSAKLMSDSGWECDATDMDGIYYNRAQNVVVFTQDFDSRDYIAPLWERLRAQA